MKKRLCILFCNIHLIALAVSTYIAAIEIESILVSGVVCSVTGVMAGITCIACKRVWLAIACLLTPFMAVNLLILESTFLQLGPSDAAEPFCVVFIVNQIISTLIILVHLKFLVATDESHWRQLTIQTLLVCTASFALFFGIAKILLRMEHDWKMSMALGLLGLVFVGLTVILWPAMISKFAGKNVQYTSTATNGLNCMTTGNEDDSEFARAAQCPFEPPHAAVPSKSFRLDPICLVLSWVFLLLAMAVAFGVWATTMETGNERDLAGVMTFGLLGWPAFVVAFLQFVAGLATFSESSKTWRICNVASPLMIFTCPFLCAALFKAIVG